MPTTVLTVLVSLAVVVLVVARRARPRPVAEEALRRPLILSAVGLFLLRGTTLDAAGIAFLLLTAVLALGLGAARGAVVRLSEQGGRLFTSWGPACFGLLAALIVVRLGVDAGAVALGVTSTTVGRSVLFALGLSLLAESAVVAHRTGRPALALR
ncbi:hypothetical protein ACFQ46_09715 [Kineococcus sp. GCM10028916]|uniref:hypothetical protein n=1 Tax=Kineococcus sp. GCM10028916 TaxID=3273394 RepID=UPI00363DCE75